ncbi:hypothetical protein B7463_g817, partial [Scytalidium lignicola]
MSGKRLDKVAHTRYPDIDAFGPVTFSRTQHKLPTPEAIITRLQNYNFQNQVFEVLQNLAEDMILYGRHGKKLLPLGQMGAREYHLQLFGLSQTSLNDNDELGRLPLFKASCFLSHLKATSKMDNSKIHHRILPLGILLVNGSQVPWIIVMNQDHILWSLHPASIHHKDIIIEGMDINNVSDSLGNHISLAPFSWARNCPENGIPFNADDPSCVYNLGSVSRLSNVLKQPKQRIRIEGKHCLSQWTTSPLWTRRENPASMGILYSLELTHVGGIIRKTTYTLGLLLVDSIPVPWIILIDSAHVLWTLHPNRIDPSDDIRHSYLADPDEDEDASGRDDFASSEVLDGSGRNIAPSPFGFPGHVVVYELGKINIMEKALDLAMDMVRYFVGREQGIEHQWTAYLEGLSNSSAFRLVFSIKTGSMDMGG